MRDLRKNNWDLDGKNLVASVMKKFGFFAPQFQDFTPQMWDFDVSRPFFLRDDVYLDNKIVVRSMLRDFSMK